MRHTAAQHSDDKTIFGFWVYLMTDCILFASLFATFAVLRGNTWGGPGGQEIFNLPLILVATLMLLISSLTSGLALVAAHRQQVRQTLVWLAFTGLLGLAFLGLELTEFNALIAEGNSWQRSGFLTAFFTLVGTHGLHILSGLIWLSALFVRILQVGLNHHTVRKLTLFSLFWHFLDIVWIFIFSMVYLMGAQLV